MPFNRQLVEGWVTSVPEIKTFDSGSMVVNFSLSKYTGLKKEDGTKLNKFISIRFGGKPSDKENIKSMVELAAEIREGDRIVVEGKVEHYVRKDKQTGAESLADYIYADAFRVFDHNEPKPRTDSKGVPKATADDFASLPGEDDIPF